MAHNLKVVGSNPTPATNNFWKRLWISGLPDAEFLRPDTQKRVCAHNGGTSTFHAEFADAAVQRKRWHRKSCGAKRGGSSSCTEVGMVIEAEGLTSISGLEDCADLLLAA